MNTIRLLAFATLLLYAYPFQDALAQRVAPSTPRGSVTYAAQTAPPDNSASESALSETGRVSAPDSSESEAIPVLELRPYGFIKADASYDDSRTTPGNYILFVDRELARRQDDEFNLTANQTRLGLNIRETSGLEVKASGKLEIDFYGNYADENKAKIQMRHAWFEVLFPGSGISLLAGQTWDVVSPLNPSTVNYTVLWEAGNIGYRRPQIRLTKTAAIGRSELQVQGAIARTVGHLAIWEGTSTETGEDNGYPTLQGRVAVSIPSSRTVAPEIGFSAHYATEECDTSSTGEHLHFRSWSANLDFSMPVTSRISLQSEAFTGSNLSAYLGGIGQGLRTVGDGFGNEIASRGGWVALYIDTRSAFQFAVGAGVDDVRDADINPRDRSSNRVLLANGTYALTEHAGIAVELSHWRTGYLDSEAADNFRAQTALTYRF